MILYFLLACVTEVEPKRSLSHHKPIFIDLDGQNWSFPNSSVGNERLALGEELTKANTLYHQEKYNEAAKRLISFLQKQPEHDVAHAILSACFFRIGDLEQAERAARNAIQYNPSVVSYSNLGSILIGQGDKEGAIQAYEEARKKDSKHFLPIRNLVTIYYSQQKLSQAEALLYELIKIDPSDSYGYVSLGQVLIDQNRWAEAEVVYRFRLADLEVLSEEDRYLAGGMMLDLPLALGRVLLKQKKYVEAEYYLRETIRQSKMAQSTWTDSVYYVLHARSELYTIYVATKEPEKAQQEADVIRVLRKSIEKK